MHTTDPPHDVLIAGAGPVGLLLACELRLAGCSVLILDKASDPHSPLKGLPFGLRGLSVPTIESLDRRDLLEAVKGSEAGPDKAGAAQRATQHYRPGGHFAGIPFFHDLIDGARWTHRLSGEVGSLATSLASIERVLTARAEDVGVAIRRGVRVDDVRQTAEDVTVQATGGSFRGRWLVGCDGGRSTVRKAARIGFAGTEPEFTGYSALLDLADPGLLEPGRHYTAAGMYIYTPPGTLGMVDFDGGSFHRTDPITREHVEAVLRRVSGSDLAVTTLHLATTWTDRACQATTYRDGRVLLAGDAAHVHSPLGGQGLNLGLGDAMNLGWKLAAVVQGNAPPGLLNSYERERHPVGAQVLDWSRAQVALMRPNRASRAIAAIMRDLIDTRDGATYFAERVWGVGLRYDLGGGHPLVGRSVPDFTFEGGGRVAGTLRSGRGLLLDFGTNTALRALAAPWGDRVDRIEARVAESLGTTAALVRPDGVVAWACGSSVDLAGAEQALARWFGAPGRAASS